jgi:DNA-binding CsgD family transcriptional regulator
MLRAEPTKSPLRPAIPHTVVDPFLATTVPVLVIDLDGHVIGTGSTSGAILETSGPLDGQHHHVLETLSTVECLLCAAIEDLESGLLPGGGVLRARDGSIYAVACTALFHRGQARGLVATFTGCGDGDWTHGANAGGAHPILPLTPRERETLLQLAHGCSARETAEALGISHNTARNHIQSVLRKLDVRNKAEAVVCALHLGLIRPGDLGLIHSDPGDRAQ